MAGSYRIKGDKIELTVSCGFDSNGKRIRKYKYIPYDSSKRKIEKELALFTAECEKLRNKEEITLSQFIDEHYKKHAYKKLRDNTITSYNLQIKNIKEHLGHKKIIDIKPKHLLLFYEILNKPGLKKKLKGKSIAEKSIYEHHRLLKNIFKFAINLEFIKENAAFNIMYAPKVSKQEVNTLKLEDVKKLFICLDKETIRYQCIINILIYTGIRKSELIGLNWEDIDFESGSIKINKQFMCINNKLKLGPVKTLKSNRIVYIPDHVVELLKTYKEHSTNNIVFTNKKGMHISHNLINEFLKSFLKRNNITYITVHALRHIHASLLIKAGIPLPEVAENLGQADTNTLSRRYAHSMENDNSNVPIVLNNLLN